MNRMTVDDADRPRLHALMTMVQNEMSRLPLAPDLKRELESAWAALVEELSSSTSHAPLQRVCPSCGHSGMRDATRCGYCWEKLAPLPQIALADSGPGEGAAHRLSEGTREKVSHKGEPGLKRTALESWDNEGGALANPRRRG